MLEVHIPSVGPEDPRQSPEKGHMVFRVEVLCRRRRHTVQRRYSEFHALHKRVRLRRRPTDPGPAPAQLLGDGRTNCGPILCHPHYRPRPWRAPVLGTDLPAGFGVDAQGQGPACTVDANAWPARPRALGVGRLGSLSPPSQPSLTKVCPSVESEVWRWGAGGLGETLGGSELEGSIRCCDGTAVPPGRSRNCTKCPTSPQNACLTGGPEDWSSGGRAWRPISRVSCT
ncbi:sorting nexin-22 isoform X1 [Ursus arctos]|uniref:sorting nexin-22 isoform X1 n=1 Tax=Ursus arctos TaxID=9644 RepID=UPI001CF8DAC9|nr:sorting nexin-22 isoform X1 [Ursus arctos]